MIDVSKIVQQAVGSVKKNVKDVVKTVTYKQVTGDAEYDPDTGETGQTFTNHTLPNAILTSFKFNERVFFTQGGEARTIEVGDQKMLVPYADLPLTPTNKDIVVIGGQEWEVVNFAIDPTGSALHTFQIRRI